MTIIKFILMLPKTRRFFILKSNIIFFFSLNNLYLLLIVVLFLGGNIELRSSSVSISNMLVKYAAGDIDYCTKNIKKVADRYKNNSNIFYLQGCLEKDGLKSLKYFKRIAFKFPKSSKFKVAKKKINDYQRLKAVLGKKDYFVQKKEIKKKVQHKNRAAKNTLLYSVQLGAFQNRINAEKLLIKYKDLAPRIVGRSINNKKLNLVLCGSYKSAIEAKDKVLEIQKKYKIRGAVKKL